MSAPRFPDAVLAEYDWRHVRDDTETALSLPLFTITAYNTIYEHAPSSDAFAAVGDPEVDVSGRSAFTSALEFSTPLMEFGFSPASVFGIACDHAKTEFADSVREDGLVNVTRFADRDIDRVDRRGDPRGTGSDPARAFGYDVEYPLVDDVIAEDVTSGQFTVRGELWAIIWPTDRAYAMAGGMFPTENVADAIARQAPAATLATDTDLDVDVERDRERLLDALKRAETVD
ncbi:hypothetical protein [Halorubellus sp. PRR65]|uniref:hypothetical protein n=1 Tax=Halorubellus sp. PRR65 TaxID=3098148 RepID=UPI002B25EAE2|nr:hypothetical protein [Halorubellus sp. PRR65]